MGLTPRPPLSSLRPMPERRSDEDVIPLNRFRATLARARSTRRADVILADSDPAALVAALSIQELYYAIQEVGLNDAEELVGLLTPEQLQGCFDLDLWDRDRFDEQRMGQWMAVISEGGLRAIERAVSAIDPEEMALFLKRQATVYDLELDVAPEEPVGFYFLTPDRFFMLDMMDTGDSGKTLARLVENLYRIDVELGRRVVMSAKWELESDLEEMAYRFRSGRMADLGYTEFYDSLSIYRALDPASVRIGEGTRSDRDILERTLPTLFAREFDELGLLGHAFGSITEGEELERLQGTLITLVNKALAANRVEPGDRTTAREIFKEVASLLNLGLEFLAQRDVERAASALRTIALERLFRLGFSLTLKFHALAQSLLREGRIRIGGHVLLDSPLFETISAVLEPRPRYSAALDDPRETTTRPFSSLEDLAKVAAALREAAGISILLFEDFGVSSTQVSMLLESQGAFRFGTLIRTMVARKLLSGLLNLEPLSVEEVRLFESRLREGRLSTEDRNDVEKALKEKLTSGESTSIFERWFPRWVDNMGAHLAHPDGLLSLH
jgi:hypothetical protein